MTFRSVLFPEAEEPAVVGAVEEPECFHDLHLDQVVAAVTATRPDYQLSPLFHQPVRTIDAIVYRQAVMRDLQGAGVRVPIDEFATRMRATREDLSRANKAYYEREKQLWLLTAVHSYCDAVEQLGLALSQCSVRSPALLAFQAYLAGYLGSEAFERLSDEARRLTAAIAALRYSLHIRNGTVTVRAAGPIADYSAAVERTFEKFRRAVVRDFRVTFRDPPTLTHVDAWILDGLATAFPDSFDALAHFAETHQEFIDDRLARFDREIHFYVSYLCHMERVGAAGLTFCYPEVSPAEKRLCVRESFDLALADALIARKAPVTTNDIDLHDSDRVIVVTGPNQGGKTTFARMVGQIHYLASLGVPIPGTEARVVLCDQVFTHFERAEQIATLRGRLHDDLVRLRSMLDRATPHSLLVFNELFSSTTVQDAVWLSRHVMAEVLRRDLLAVWVTFLGELTSFNQHTVSMVSVVDPDDPAKRTYKLERQPAATSAYAVLLARKYGVTYDQLIERLGTCTRG